MNAHKAASYDEMCEQLARHFLGARTSDELVAVLAQHIQDAVEDWINARSGDEAKRLGVKWPSLSGRE